MGLLSNLFVVLAIALAGFFGGWQVNGWRHQVIEDQMTQAIQAQKIVAGNKLADLNRQFINQQTALDGLRSSVEQTREQLQSQNAADLRNRLGSGRLRVPVDSETAGRWCGGGSAPAGAPGAAGDAGAASVELPEQTSDDLRQLAADAQSLAIDYRVLYDWVHNPRLACQLSP